MKILKFVFFLIVLLLLFRFVFVFRQIDCFSTDVTLESGVCEKINDHFKNKSLFFTDFENDQVWDELIAVQEYSQVYQYQEINKSLLGKAKLYLIAKKPDYRLLIGQDKYVLNQSNKLKNNQENLTLPTIELIGDQNVINHGYLSEDQHSKFLSLSQALQKYEIKTERILWQNEQEIHLFLAEIEVVLDVNKDFNYQMERLSLVLKQDDIKAVLSTKKLLDMRFNLPVLK